MIDDVELPRVLGVPFVALPHGMGGEADGGEGDHGGSNEGGFAFHEKDQGADGGRVGGGVEGRCLVGEFQDMRGDRASTAGRGVQHGGKQVGRESGSLGLDREERAEHSDRRHLDPPAAEQLAQHVTGSGESGAKRGGLKIEPLGDLMEGSAFEMEEHQRLAVAIRQKRQRGIQFAAETGALRGVRSVVHFYVHGGLLTALAAFRGPAGIEGQMPRDRVKPPGHRRLSAQPGGLPRQGQESGLGHVLGVVMIGHHPQCDRVDHWPVALDKNGEGGVVPASGEFPQEVGIGLLVQLTHFTTYHGAGPRNVSKNVRNAGRATQVRSGQRWGAWIIMIALEATDRRVRQRAVPLCHLNLDVEGLSDRQPVRPLKPPWKTRMTKQRSLRRMHSSRE